MDRKTRTIIAATVIVLGLGVIALGYFEDESTVRYVSDLYAPGNELDSGSYTLLGIPQPELLPDGSDNPQYVGFTATFRQWSEDGVDYVTWIEVRANQTAPSEWTFTQTERTTTRSSTTQIGPIVTQQWILEGDYQVFLVDDFEAPGMRTWAAFGGVLNGDILPKPSQLQGRLAAETPAEMRIWLIEPDGYTVGCSSKFLPDEVRDEYDADGDGQTD